MGVVSLMDFVCTGPCLVLDLPVFLQETDGENHINIMGDKVVRLDNILQFFNKGGRIDSVEH